MTPPDKWLYEYAVVRYMPLPERGEFINIGLVMLSKRNKWLKGEILIQPEVISLLFPKTDFDTLINQASIFEKTDVPQKDLPIEEKYRWLTSVKSACLRVSPSHPGLISAISDTDCNMSEILDKEFRRLFDVLVKRLP